MRFLSLIFVFSFLSFGASAQDTSDIVKAIDDRANQLDVIAEDVSDDKTDLLAIRDFLRDIKQQGQNQSEPYRIKQAQVTSDLDRLGTPPSEGMLPEAVSIAQERQRLLNELSQLNGIIRKSDLNIAEADRLLAEISVLRRQKFSDSVFEQDQSVLDPRLWKDSLGIFREDVSLIKDQYQTWWAQKVKSEQGWETILAVVLAVVLLLACFIPLRRQLRMLIANRLRGVEPHGSRKVLVLAAYAAGRMLPALLGGWIFYQTMISVGIVTDASRGLLQLLWGGFASLIVVDAVAGGLAASYAPKWRILHVKDSQSLMIRGLAFAAASGLVFENIVTEIIAVAGNTDVSLTLLTSLVTILLAVILFLASRATLWSASDGEVLSSDIKFWPRIRLIGKIVAIVSVIATLIGFSNLGHYLTSSTFYLLALAAVVWVLRSILREIVRLFDARFTNPVSAKSEHDSLIFYWIGFGIDVVSGMVFIPPALLILGAEWVDVRDGVGDALVGIQIGNFNFSILKIVAAVTFFLVLLSLTRLVQRTAETRIFPKSRIDVGVQNSLKTLIGYAGLIVAFLVAVSAVGFNLSNLAIIAGALSIGIGFGLQSIVSNFVSGLILLFERPIKVGDWVVTSSGEGFVKKISVRATEIETFDRASVIVPNSELISSSVTNWTHKDKIGRVIVPVGVSYSADPEKVIELLEAVAKEHPQILDYPEPFIYFADFADSSLNFEVRGFISDVKSGIKIRSELRVAIFKKLKEAGIEIPFPQRDVHFKSGVSVDGE